MNREVLDSGLRNVLQLLIGSGGVESINTYLKQGMSPNAIIDEQKGFTLLHCAAEAGPWQVIATLIKAGAEVNARSTNNWTPLHLAACRYNYLNVIVLLCGGADVGARTNDGYTALHLAAQKSVININKDSVEILLAADSRGDIIDDKVTHELILAQDWKNCQGISLLESRLKYFQEERNKLVQILAHQALYYNNKQLFNLPVEIAQECARFMQFEPYRISEFELSEKHVQKLKEALRLKQLPPWLTPIIRKEPSKLDGHLFNIAYIAAAITLGGRIFLLAKGTEHTVYRALFMAGAPLLTSTLLTLPKACFRLYALNPAVKPLIVNGKQVGVGALLAGAAIYASKNHSKLAWVGSLAVISGCTAFTALLKVVDIHKVMGGGD